MRYNLVKDGQTDGSGVLVGSAFEYGIFEKYF